MHSEILELDEVGEIGVDEKLDATRCTSPATQSPKRIDHSLKAGSVTRFGTEERTRSTRTCSPCRSTHGAVRNVPPYITYSMTSTSQGIDAMPS